MIVYNVAKSCIMYDIVDSKKMFKINLVAVLIIPQCLQELITTTLSVMFITYLTAVYIIMTI